MMIIKKTDRESVVKVADCLKNGGIAVLPTDTVYGFSAVVDLKNMAKKETDARIRAIKGRAETKPFIELIARPEDIQKYTADRIPAELLSKWPGPLTVIVTLKDDCPLDTNLKTVAFRCPGDAWLRNIIDIVGAPIYSTSVNRSGRPVLDAIPAISAEFGNEVDLIVDGGATQKNALPSTIVSVEEGHIKIVRQGATRFSNARFSNAQLTVF